MGLASGSVGGAIIGRRSGGEGSGLAEKKEEGTSVGFYKKRGGHEKTSKKGA